MSSVWVWLTVSSLVLGLLALWLNGTQARRARRACVFERMTRDLPVELSGGELRPSHLRSRLLRDRLLRAGVQPAAWHLPCAMLAFAVSLAVGASLRGWMGAAAAAASSLFAFYVATGWAAGVRRERLLEQLPGFLEHLLRAVDAGGSVQQGLRIATEEAAEPLRGTFERVNRKIQLGADLDEAMRQLELLDLRELGMIALTIRVNQRFGGSIRELLRSVVASVRLRDRGRRELNALTGETRLSAWVLALLPMAVGLYISVVNPSYLDTMLGDVTGRKLLVGASLLQVVGAATLWRMVKAV